MSAREIVIGFRAPAQTARQGFRVKLPPVAEEPETDAEVYEGPYEVRPTPGGETMQTEGKLMKDDVTVQPIPYFVVSNDAGGETVYIGE